MAIVNELGFSVVSLEERLFITCSTAQVANSGNPFLSTGASTGNAAPSSDAAVGISGRIIDRLSAQLTPRFTVAWPFTELNSTRGSTEANRQVSVGVKLQHGDSSGGGDMADYSTGSQPDNKVYFTTARTSDMAAWSTGESDGGGSTGPFRGASAPAYYDLRGAKRYIRAVHIASKNRVTTESSGDEQARISGGITFVGGDQLPMRADFGYASTSTST